MSLPLPIIPPLDCLVLGNVSSISRAGVPLDENARTFHFWGRDREPNRADETELCFVDHYEPASSSSHGATDTPIYHQKRLQYLGLRTVDTDIILQYFRTHFDLRNMAARKMAFTTSGGNYTPVLTRWPASDWYYLFPKGSERPTSADYRLSVWNTWCPGRPPGTYWLAANP